VSPWLVAPLVDIVDGRAVLDESHARKRADWSFEGEQRDSYHDPVERFADAPVEIRATHTPESRRGESRPVMSGSPVRSDRFSAIHDVHTEIEDTMAALRATKPEDREFLLDRLRHLLDGHREVVETYLYPLVERLEPQLGADVTWYPKHHDHHAARLLSRLQSADESTGTRLLDDLCADIHASIIEIDRRVLPLLDRDLDDPAFERELDAIAAEELDRLDDP
jgi:hypothetical protein